MKQNHWYESVTEPLYEDSRTFGGLTSIKEGQLPNELPTRTYFTHHQQQQQQQQRNPDKMIASTRTHSLLQPSSSHSTVLENSARLLTNTKKSSPVIEQQQLTDQATIQRWLNTNGYKLSDFGLSDRTTSEADNNIQVFESPDKSIVGDITKSYTGDVLSKIGLNSDQAMITTEVTGVTSKRPAVEQGSSSRKEKVLKKKQTTKHGKPDHQKKIKANTTQRLAKIANLISLLKDYSSLKHKKQKKVPSKSKHLNNKHQQRQLPSVIPHHGEIVTSSEEVQENETAASDKEANMKGEMMRFSTQTKLDGDYHNSLKSSSLVGSPLSAGVSPHHLVTVDTTTGKIYAERMIPHDDFDELGFAFTGGSKKTSLGFIPQQNTAENGIRRAKTPVEPPPPTSSSSKKKQLIAKKHKTSNGKTSTRETLLKRISKQLSFISTDQLKRLDNTLNKLKHLHKKH